MPSALEAILDYYQTFSTLELSAIVPYFCEPSLTISPQGVFAAANRDVLAESLAPLVHSLRARGYGRSEYVQPHVTMLGETAALVRGVAVRYAEAGPELERIPISYLMHRSDAGWKIAALVAEKAVGDARGNGLEETLSKPQDRGHG